jgi:hypothetical protein
MARGLLQSLAKLRFWYRRCSCVRLGVIWILQRESFHAHTSKPNGTFRSHEDFSKDQRRNSYNGLAHAYPPRAAYIAKPLRAPYALDHNLARGRKWTARRNRYAMPNRCSPPSPRTDIGQRLCVQQVCGRSHSREPSTDTTRSSAQKGHNASASSPNQSRLPTPYILTNSIQSNVNFVRC